MALRNAHQRGGVDHPKTRKSALSLRDKWFHFHGLLPSKRAALTAAITAANGHIFSPQTINSDNSDNSGSVVVVYVITDYWVDALYKPRRHSRSFTFVPVTEFWLSEMLRTQEWVDEDTLVFFTPPPKPRGPVSQQRLLSYPMEFEEEEAKQSDGAVAMEVEDSDVSMLGGSPPPRPVLMKLPCSLDNLWRDQVPLWPYFVAFLNLPMRNARELSIAIKCITGSEDRRPLNCLESAINELLSKEQRDVFFKTLVPEMVRLVLNLPSMFAKRPSLLAAFCDPLGSDAHSAVLNQSCSFTKLEALALVSGCFFCIFPSQSRIVKKQQTTSALQESEEQHTEGEDDDEVDFPFFTMQRMYFAPHTSSAADLKAQKIRCVLQYFLRVVPLAVDEDSRRRRLDDEVITFTRVAVSFAEATKKPSEMTPRDLLDGLNLAADPALAMRDVRCESDHLIEELDGHLQIDFANKYAGGSVFNNGCVQEEIRFLLSPELFVACLVFAKLESNESFVIHGTERYCSYGGYGSSFVFKGNYDDQTRFESISVDANGTSKRRRQCVIVGIDAVDYGSFSVGRQYTRVHIWRDLVKAFVGFAYHDRGSSRWPVATGNWGCGVFRGDSELKFLIQWLAASLAGRDLVYVLFERDQELHDSIMELLQVFHRVNEESAAQVVPLLVSEFLLNLDVMLRNRVNTLRSAARRMTRPSVLALAREFLHEKLQDAGGSFQASSTKSAVQTRASPATKHATSPVKRKSATPGHAADSPKLLAQESSPKRQLVHHQQPEGKSLQQKSLHDFFGKK